MKKRDKDELRGMNPEELKKKIGALRKQLSEVRLTMQTKEVKNRKAGKELSKKLAVAFSILRMKELT